MASDVKRYGAWELADALRQGEGIPSVMLSARDHDRIVAEKDAVIAERDATIQQLREEVDSLERRIDLTECGGPR